MAYGVFDRNDDNEMISGSFTTEDAAETFRLTYSEDEDFEGLYVDRICPKHFTDYPEQKCPCWEDMPYDDERGSLI